MVWQDSKEGQTRTRDLSIQVRKGCKIRFLYTVLSTSLASAPLFASDGLSPFGDKPAPESFQPFPLLAHPLLIAVPLSSHESDCDETQHWEDLLASEIAV